MYVAMIKEFILDLKMLCQFTTTKVLNIFQMNLLNFE